MKGTLVTEENYNQICGRLKKFFDHHNFMVWHTFDSGFKKRNPMMCRFPSDHKKHSVVRLEPAVADYIDDGTLLIEYGINWRLPGKYPSRFIVESGMGVWFLGNRVTFKRKRARAGRVVHLYLTFQIANPKQIAAVRDGGMHDNI